MTRQLWRLENLTGNYYGGLIGDYFGCTNPAANGHNEQLAAFNINHTGSAITMTFIDVDAVRCNFSATYSQAGHMGTMQGNYTCTNGVVGSFTAFELEKNLSGVTGRFVGQNAFSNVSCQFSGHLGVISMRVVHPD